MTRIPRRPRLRGALLAAVLAVATAGAGVPDPPAPAVFVTSDSAVVHGDLYGSGPRAVVLAHGGRFDRKSWEPQARILAANGFRALAIDFRGYGESRGPGDSDPLSAPLENDILAAVRYLRENGAASVSVVGGSMGGSAAARATMQCRPGEIERVVLLGAPVRVTPEKMTGRKLFICAREDSTGDGTRRLVRIRAEFEMVPEPRELVVLDGAAHAQELFRTTQGDRVMREILRFLTAP
jgi:pimeloyl-ACP methyl ester carboxylesterase